MASRCCGLSVFGFAAYAIWRLSEAAFGTAAEGNKTVPRLQALVRGVVYAALAVSTVSFIAGTSKQGQSQQQATLTARAMKHEYGRWLVGVIGLIVVVIGLGMIVESVRKKFKIQLRMEQLSGRTRSFVVRLSMIGTVARVHRIRHRGRPGGAGSGHLQRGQVDGLGRRAADAGRPPVRAVAARGTCSRAHRLRTRTPATRALYACRCGALSCRGTMLAT